MTMEVSGIILSGNHSASGGGGASNLSGLTDVSFVGTPSDGQVLKFNAAANVWQNSFITPEISAYIQNNLLGINGIAVSTHGGKHYINFEMSASGDVVPAVVSNGNLDLRLATVNSAPGTYGGSNQMPVITVDAKGRVTKVTTADIETSAGTVSYVAMSGGTTGLTVTGGPIMSSGQFTLGGRLNVASGGTGATTLSGYVVANGVNPFTAVTTIPGADIVGDIPGTAAAAHMLKTPRTFTIGQSARTFDGTASVNWSLASIGAVNRAGDKLTGALDYAVPGQIPLANYINLAASATNIVEIIAGTGQTITSLGTAAAGAYRKILFSTNATLVHSSGISGIRLPGSLNMRVNVGDVVEATSMGAGLWSCAVITRALQQLDMFEVVSNTLAADVNVHYLIAGANTHVTVPQPGAARGARLRITNVSGAATPVINFSTFNYRGAPVGTRAMTGTWEDVELVDSGSAAIGWV